jgi:DGQHR domain-containing protein
LDFSWLVIGVIRNMINLDILHNAEGRELEDEGRDLFCSLDFNCFGRLNHVRLLDIDPEGLHSPNDHLEIDYIIPVGNFCILGEITARSGERAVSRKYSRFRRQYDLLTRLDWNDNLLTTIGIPQDQHWKFSDIQGFRGVYISTQFEKIDLELAEVGGMVCLYKSDLTQLTSYGNSIGKYYRNHLLHLFDIDLQPQNAIRINQTHHNLMILSNKRIVGTSPSRVNLFSFDISPYEIIPFSFVYRRDQLPTLITSVSEMYQRPLLPKKLNAIRRDLLQSPEFIFPNSILVVLSEDSSFSRNQLIIPQSADAISIIDGQHRLFSYAEADVEERMSENSKIMVTAIQLIGATHQEIIELSAKAFIEINRNQTKIKPSHIDSIAYDILGDTNPRAISANVLLKVNVENRTSALFCLFSTNQSSLGIISPSTIITHLKTIFNREMIERLVNTREGSAGYSRMLGYMNLFDSENILELSQPEILIQKGQACIIRFFNLVREHFQLDWPNPRQRVEDVSSFYYAKFVAAWVRLLNYFIAQGFDWDEVSNQIEHIKINVMNLRGMEEYDEKLFFPIAEVIPDANISVSNDFKFLKANIESPTSIQLIMQNPNAYR